MLWAFGTICLSVMTFEQVLSIYDVGELGLFVIGVLVVSLSSVFVLLPIYKRI